MLAVRLRAATQNRPCCNNLFDSVEDSTCREPPEAAQGEHQPHNDATPPISHRISSSPTPAAPRRHPLPQNAPGGPLERPGGADARRRSAAFSYRCALRHAVKDDAARMPTMQKSRKTVEIRRYDGSRPLRVAVWNVQRVAARPGRGSRRHRGGATWIVRGRDVDSPRAPSNGRRSTADDRGEALTGRCGSAVFAGRTAAPPRGATRIVRGRPNARRG